VASSQLNLRGSTSFLAIGSYWPFGALAAGEGDPMAWAT
jgi:hypothetical protein